MLSAWCREIISSNSHIHADGSTAGDFNRQAAQGCWPCCYLSSEPVTNQSTSLLIALLNNKILKNIQVPMILYMF